MLTFKSVLHPTTLSSPAEVSGGKPTKYQQAERTIQVPQSLSFCTTSSNFNLCKALSWCVHRFIKDLSDKLIIPHGTEQTI